MQDFDPIAAVSLENVPVTWVARLAGVEIDPSPTGLNLPVQFAFPVSSGNELQPAEPGTWINGSWFAGTTSVGHVAIILAGPGGAVTLSAGTTYDVWSRIIGSPEQPAKFCGQLRVY